MGFVVIVLTMLLFSDTAVARSHSRGEKRQRFSKNTPPSSHDKKSSGTPTADDEQEKLAAEKKAKRKKRHAKMRTGLAVGGAVIAATGGLTAIAANGEKIAAG